MQFYSSNILSVKYLNLCSYCNLNFYWPYIYISDTMRVFRTVKRLNHFRSMEPMFFATRKEPLFDERLSIEGKSDKMSQGYTMCQLNYDYMFLSNAFLIHRFGKKSRKEKRLDPPRNYFPGRSGLQGFLIRRQIKPQIHRLYGNISGCR